MNKQILIAPNAFKHSLCAIQIARIIKSSLRKLDKNLRCAIAPIADGGDETIDILKFYFKKSKFVKCTVHDPLMRRIKSRWLFLNKNTAVIELAKASGLVLLKKNELDPLVANTYGTGQLILSALSKGCRNIVIALGGSATVDAGLGILTALGVKIYDKNKNLLNPRGNALTSIACIDLSGIDKRIKDCRIHVMCDVQSILYGKNGTVNFSKQKGASVNDQLLLEQRMKNYVKIVKKIKRTNYHKVKMVGAAGGVAYTLKSLLKASLFNGFIYLANLVSLESKIKNSAIIISGEGRLDAQTLMGKGVFELAKYVKKYDKKLVLLCGDYEKKINWSSYNVNHVIKIRPMGLSLAKSIKNAKLLIKQALNDNIELFKNY